MNLSEDEIVRKLIELQNIDKISNKFVKHLYLYDLSALMVFRPSQWNNGFILSLLDSNWESMEQRDKNDVDKIFLQRLIEVVSNVNALTFYYANPIIFVNEVARYLNETMRYTFITIEEEMTDAESEMFKQHVLQEYLNMVTERFHLITDQIFRRHGLLDIMIYQNEQNDNELPDYSLTIKSIDIETSDNRLLANLFVYEMVRKDLC